MGKYAVSGSSALESIKFYMFGKVSVHFKTLNKFDFLPALNIACIDVFREKLLV